LFDNNCIFGNIVEMNFSQATQLRAVVEKILRSAVKGYVCTLTKSFLAPFCGKMVSLYHLNI
jgi:hypothetical protein